MLGLYLDTLIIGHNFCSMISIIKWINSAKKELPKKYVKMLFGQKINKNTITKQTKKTHKNCQSQELNLGPLVPQSGVLPLGHQVNWT